MDRPTQADALRSLRYLESALDDLSANDKLGRYRHAFAALAARTVLLRSQLGSGVNEDYVQSALPAFIADYGTLLRQLRSME